MHGLGRHAGLKPYARRGLVALAIFAKLVVIAGLLIWLGPSVSALGWGAALHGLAAAAIAGLALFVGLRHMGRVGHDSKDSGEKAIGIILHGAARYDLLASILTLGRETRLRNLMLGLARLQPGETVLDVACGTGTLALAAKRQVGLQGRVIGVDASAEMIERARAKGAKAGLDLTFVGGAAQALPFGRGQFDIVIGTLMLHHLPKPARADFAGEARRVLKPGGRLLLIDFGRPARRSGWPRFHRHGHLDMQAIAALLTESGFEICDIGAVGTMNLHYVRATLPQELLA